MGELSKKGVTISKIKNRAMGDYDNDSESVEFKKC